MTPAKVCSWEGFIITKWPRQSRQRGGDTKEAATVGSPGGSDEGLITRWIGGWGEPGKAVGGGLS